MKKNFKIILWILFAISCVFILTGVLVVDNSFYVKNNTDQNVAIFCKSSDGSVSETIIESGDSAVVYNKKVLRINNKPLDYTDYVLSITSVSGASRVVINEPEWTLTVNKRRNIFVAEINES